MILLLVKEQPYTSDARDYVLEAFALSHEQPRIREDTVISRNNASHRTRIYLDTEDRRFSQLLPQIKLKRLRLTKYDSQDNKSAYYLEVKYEEKIGNERFVSKIRLPLLDFKSINNFLQAPTRSIDLDFLLSLPAELQVLNPEFSSLPKFDEARQAIIQEIGNNGLAAVLSSEYERQSTGKKGRRITIDRGLIFKNLERKAVSDDSIDELFALLSSKKRYNSASRVIELKGNFPPEAVAEITKALSLSPYTTKFQEAHERFCG